MPHKRPLTVHDHRRMLRREASIVASDLARKLQHVPAGIEAFGPLVLAAFRDRNSEVFSEIDENQVRYEGRDENWFCLVRQVRNHSEWGPQLFESLRSDNGDTPD